MTEPITYEEAVRQLSGEFETHHRELIGGEAFEHLRALVADGPLAYDAGGDVMCFWCNEQKNDSEPAHNVGCPYFAAMAFLRSLEAPKADAVVPLTER